MKYLKLFESQSIEDICKEYNIENYHINSDGTVDVHGDVNLRSRDLDKIPLKFGEVSGYFSCVGVKSLIGHPERGTWAKGLPRSNKLKNLIGCPKRVGRYFACGWNSKLTSLESCPTYIGGYFDCPNNSNLWSMDHFPRHAKDVNLWSTPIMHIFRLFRNVYLEDGGKYFKTSWSLMDFFEHCDPVWNNFLASIDKELRPEDIGKLKNSGWKIED